MIWSWIPQNWSLIWQLTWENAKLGVLSALYGLIISLPLGIIAARWRWFYPPTLAVVNVVYAVPSLALWIALIPAFGLTDTTVIIGLTAFSLCVILPNVVEGLRAVPAPVRQAATAMGYGATRRLVMVELPLAAPVIKAFFPSSRRLIAINSCDFLRAPGGGVARNNFDPIVSMRRDSRATHYTAGDVTSSGAASDGRADAPSGTSASGRC